MTRKKNSKSHRSDKAHSADNTDSTSSSSTRKKTRNAKADFAVVGIGASAGGVQALEELFNHLPINSGLAFVVIMHLSKDYQSNLHHLLDKYTEMPVQSVEEGQVLAPDHVFIIPADRTLTLEGHELILTERKNPPGQFRPIDLFFESLARQFAEKAIGVILSGTGTDGTLGCKAIKGAGGITFAQSTESAQFEEMPSNAMNSGQIDIMQDLDEIAHEIGELGRHPHLENFLETIRKESPSGWNLVQKQLKTTGIDFPLYKQSTIRRRISRRMAIQKITNVKEYANLLEDNPQELIALREDLLIKVTEFFRDPETFDVLLKKVMPRIVGNKNKDQPIRIWVPGCASGEEVYSLAMLAVEAFDEKQSFPSLQLFGTDISKEAVEKARRGIYSEAQTSGISREHLRKFFTKVHGGFQIKKHLREMCIFAYHDFTSDPPFSRLDLISCRNVLIYFSAALQKKVFPMFHYALNPEGILFLGSSESIGQADDLFSCIDKKHRIYETKKVSQPIISSSWSSRQGQQGTNSKEIQSLGLQSKNNRKNLHREVDRALLRSLEPVAVLIDQNMKIVQFRGETSSFIEHPPGQATLDLLRIVRDNLRYDLRNLLQEIRKEGAPQRREVQILEEEEERTITLEATSVAFEGDSYYLIQFHSNLMQPVSDIVAPRNEEITDSMLWKENQRLKRELISQQHYLQQAVEEKDEALEDLKAANEEILSSNEELQSINEEVETAKEELESGNEELTTVNLELQNRNEEISAAHDDLRNLILSVQIPFLIVNTDLEIRRISENAKEMLLINQNDVGRSLTNLKLSFEFPGLEKALRTVIDSGAEVEEEIQDRKGDWNLLRIRPYRTEEKGGIHGAVLTLFDIQRLKRSIEETEKAYKYALQIVETIKDPLLVIDGSFQITKANPAFFQKFQVSPDETLGQTIFNLGSGQWNNSELRRLLKEILPQSTLIDDIQVEFNFPHLGQRRMLLTARKMRTSSNFQDSILLGIRDVTEQQQAEKYLRIAKIRAEEASLSKSEFLANMSHEIRSPLTVILGALEHMQVSDSEQDRQRCMQLAEKSGNLLLELIGDILDFSRIEANRMNLENISFNLKESVEETTLVMANTAKEKNLSLDLEIADAVPEKIRGDQMRLRQVLTNLISNAIKFTEQGGIKVRVNIKPSGSDTQNDERTILFQVSDSGPGIPKTKMQRLFKNFSQVDASINRHHGGSGLGLAISKGIVERMGGEIWAESRLGLGSDFYFTLPCRPERREKIRGSEPDDSMDSSAVESETNRILLVEDDPDIQELVKMFLAGSGWSLETADSGVEAISAWRKRDFDLILMDLQMSPLSGLDTTCQIRQEEKKGEHIPILGLTANATPQAREDCLEAGMDEVLTKPLRKKKLKEIIRRYSES